ncbi:MAG: hypothetical protein JW861_11395 [Bacteroidales bacterium]|nr:hypothetical protein [Bacteroidales bacterium]
MKKPITIFAILFASFLILGAILRFDRLLGGEYAILLGLGISGLALSILLFTYIFRNTRNLLYLAGIPVAILMILAILNNFNYYFINGIFWFRIAWLLGLIFLAAILIYCGYIRKELSFLTRTSLIVFTGLLSLLHIVMFYDAGYPGYRHNMKMQRHLEMTSKYLERQNEMLHNRIQNDTVAQQLRDSTHSALSSLDDFSMNYMKHFQSLDARIFKPYLSSTWSFAEAGKFIERQEVRDLFGNKLGNYLKYLADLSGKEPSSFIELIITGQNSINGSQIEGVFSLYDIPTQVLVNMELFKVQILLAENAILRDLIKTQSISV